jgi:hypothetical protein
MCAPQGALATAADTTQADDHYENCYTDYTASKRPGRGPAAAGSSSSKQVSSSRSQILLSG